MAGKARIGASFIVCAVVAFGFAGALPAQERPAPSPVLKNFELTKQGYCAVFAMGAPPGQPQPEVKPLHAKCGDRVLMLGSVTAFEAVGSDALEATLVDARLGTERRILLLSKQADGEPLVEDLNGQIARAAGRGPMSDIDGVELDFRQFGRTGDVGLRGRVEDRARAKTDRIGLGQQIALERGRKVRGVRN